MLRRRLRLFIVVIIAGFCLVPRLFAQGDALDIFDRQLAVLTIKQASDRLTIWALDRLTGEPIRGQSIAVYSAQGTLQGMGGTDADGIAFVDVPFAPDPRRDFVAVLATADHIGVGFTGWTAETKSSRFGYQSDWLPPAYQVYVQGDRRVYGPGQRVYFRGIVRSKDDVVYMPAPFEQAKVTIRDARATVVYERELPLNDFGAFQGLFTMPAHAPLGRYRLLVSLPQASGFPVSGGELSFQVADDGQSADKPTALPSAREYENDITSQPKASRGGLQIVPEKRRYQPGERARIAIHSPLPAPAQALLSVERGDVLRVERLSLASGENVHEFEILPNYAPNIYVSVFAFMGAEDPREADWRAGLTQLQVDIKRKILSIDIRVDRPSTAPADAIEIRLRVTDYRDEPVVAELGIAVIEEAEHSLRPQNSQPLSQAFYGPQALGIRASSSLFESAQGDRRRLPAGIGGAIGARPAQTTTSGDGFGETAYWNPSLVTDANGEATLRLRLPEARGSWRLDVRAWTEGRAGRFLVGEQSLSLAAAPASITEPPPS